MDEVFILKLFINPYTGIPLYVQVAEQIKKAVITGVIKEGEQLPPVRRLAVELLINPNTIVRAYQELEREGIITTKRGSGTFIAPTAKKLKKEQKEEEITKRIRELLAEARFLELDKEEIKKIFLLELEGKV